MLASPVIPTVRTYWVAVSIAESKTGWAEKLSLGLACVLVP